MSRCFAIACVVGVMIARGAEAQPAASDPGLAPAAQLYEQGKRHFDIADYPAAIASWKQAYLLSSEPLLLFNIAQAYRLAGDCAQANLFYQNYRRVEPKPSNQAELDIAAAKCAGVSAAPETVPAPPPPPAPIPTEATAAPVAVVTGTVDDPTDDGRTFRIAGLAVVGAGGISTIAAVVYAFNARRHADVVSRQRTGTTWSSTLSDTERAGQTAQTRSRVFGALAVVAVVGGGALWWYGRRQSRIAIDLAVSPQQTEVSVSCVF